jgi:hypothetical protein
MPEVEMNRAKRCYVSVPRDHNLDDNQTRLKHALYERLRTNGIEPQEFHVTGLPVRAPYVAKDGITWSGRQQLIIAAPPGSTPDWFDTANAKTQLDAWVAAVNKVDDIFLAYSTKGRSTANDISKFLSSRGVAICDWEIDFAPGSTILDELVKTSRNCLGAIMLLTKDDEFLGEETFAAPRDNVIFEMGMFMQAKGRERVLVVREQGAKMPADVGGGIYLSLKDRNDISPIQSRLMDFIDNRI